MKNTILIACTTATLMLSACSTTTVYNAGCSGMQQVKAAYISDNGTQLIACFDLTKEQVTICFPDGSSATLAQAVSASGARYASDNLEFWEHQGKGYYYVDGKMVFEGVVK